MTRCRTEKCTLEWLLSISQRSVLMMPPNLSVPSSEWPKGRQLEGQDRLIFVFNHLQGTAASKTSKKIIEMIGWTLNLRLVPEDPDARG
jgi:hypothetical protein